ncbi:hypothetical protein PRK78_006018 [Emydomyces testavorans]|uniref:Uncharacterized protein n=1 Tax=Emydomyces testavorans TaxID=2070801 RepID=A0AAF0DNB2_9EURO|nr:hypothetical protein PRK78_006018 [Emydomyces testavorans]
MPGAIALGAVFLVTAVEMAFSPAQHICGSSRDVSDIICAQISPASHQSKPQMHARAVDTIEEATRSSSDSRLNRTDAPEIATHKTTGCSEDTRETASEEVFPIILTPEQKIRKAFMQCVLLEIGILFHSVFIGMALSVSVGNEFVVLLVAITFHQSFEGLALGARIASLSWNPDATQPWLMALAYGCTTPIGQAIGLATHSLYDPDSEVGLIMVGTMNAISSGLLVYASLIELLAEDFLSDESWRVLRGKRRIYACLLVFFGAFGMSLVGAWA